MVCMEVISNRDQPRPAHRMTVGSGSAASAAPMPLAY